MLVVSPHPIEPAWISVLGAEVQFAPINRSMLRRARRAAMEVLGREGDGPDLTAAEQLEDLGDALSEQLILAGARDWRGVVQVVVDEGGLPVLGDDGQQQVTDLPFSREALAASLADGPTFDAFDAAYVRPFATRERERAAPGNVSAASPSTIGATETQEPITAGSPATASAADVQSAPIGSTKPRATRKRRSGKS